MELNTFIEQTLKEICQGVLAAKQAYKGGYCPIAPQTGGILQADTTKIHFELVVEASESTNKDTGGNIKVMSILSAGGKSGFVDTVKNTNKITFDIPFAPGLLEGQN